MRAEYPNHVWTYDFMQDATENGRALRILTVIDEFTRECLAIRMELFRSVQEAQVLADHWRRHYNQERPHSSIGYQTPVEFRDNWFQDPNLGLSPFGMKDVSKTEQAGKTPLPVLHIPT